jgi:hypothetical protein
MAALLALLPSLLSLPSFAPLVLAWVDRRLPGDLETESFSLGWLQGLRCENLRYRDPVLGLQLRLPALASDKGLLALLLAPSYLGEITIDQPTLVVLPPQAGPDSDRGVAPARTGGGHAPWWERRTLRLKVNQGRVVDQGPESGREIARDVELSGSLAMGTVDYLLAFRAGEGQGRLRATGFINLPAAGQPLPASLISRSELEIRDLEIADFLAIAAARGNAPHGRGVLNASCRLNASGVGELAVEGDASLRDLRLAGGFLGPDQPSFPQVQFSFKGGRRGDEWQLSNLNLQAALLRFAASGSLDRSVARLSAKGKLDLPTLAAQLPHLLNLRRQTAFKQGTIDFSLQAGGAPADLRLHADCRTERLELVHDGQALAWDTPLALDVEAAYVDGAARVGSLRAHAPFFDASGSGDATLFTLRAAADLDRMFAQLNKIFALDFHARGQAQWSASSRLADRGEYRLETRLAVDDFALARGSAVLLPTHNVALRAEAVGLPTFFQDYGLRSLQLSVSGWLGAIELHAADMQPTTGESAPAENGKTTANCFLKSTVDLARLSGVLRSLAGAPPSVSVQGRLSLEGSGQWRGDRASLDVLDGGVDRLAVATPAGLLLQAPQATLALGGGLSTGRGMQVGELTVADNWQDLQEREQAYFSVDFANRRLMLRHLRCVLPDAVIDFGLAVNDWRRSWADLGVDVRSESSAALPAALCKAKGWLAADAEARGRARTRFSSRINGPERVSELALSVEPFALRQGQRQLFADPRLQLQASLSVAHPGGGEVKVPAFTLKTRLLSVAGTGLIRPGAQALVELQGGVTPDYSALAAMLAPVIGRETILAGQEAGTFVLSAPLRVPINPDQVTLAAQLPLDSLRFCGLNLRRLSVPVELNRGRLRVQLAAPLEGGHFALQPEWQWERGQSVLTLPPVSQVLLDAPLRPGLVSGLLAPLHPLFGVLAVPEGAVDLRLDGLTLPLAGKGAAQPTFKAVIGLDKMRFKPVGPLRALLEMTGLPVGELRSKERELACEGAKGRVRCAPVRLLAGDQDVVVRGSAGAGGALDCRVELPLTEALAAQAHLSMLGDVKVEAEIGGTRTTPLFDQPAFLASLAARAAAAATVTVDEPPENGESGQGTSDPGNEPRIPVIEE